MKNNPKNLFSAQVRLISSLLRLEVYHLPVCLAWRNWSWSLRLESFSTRIQLWAQDLLVLRMSCQGQASLWTFWQRGSCELERAPEKRDPWAGCGASSSLEWGSLWSGDSHPRCTLEFYRELSVGRGPDTHFLKQLPRGSLFAPESQDSCSGRNEGTLQG